MWDIVKHQIIKINGGKGTDYRKDYIKIKYESVLPLNEPLIFYEMYIFVGFAFKEDNKLYPGFSLIKILCIKSKIWYKQNTSWSN